MSKNAPIQAQRATTDRRATVKAESRPATARRPVAAASDSAGCGWWLVAGLGEMLGGPESYLEGVTRVGDNQVADSGRRDLIKKGAVVGALAWVAPTIVSVPAASAATAPTGFTLGQVGDEGLEQDIWLAVMMVDLNTIYTNPTGFAQTITPDLFSFTTGEADPLLGAEVQPFVAIEGPGVLLAIGTTRLGPFVPGGTYTSAFGGSSFSLAPGQSIVLGARTIATSGGSPISYTSIGSTTLTGGPNTADSGTLPGVGSTPTEGTNPFTTASDPRTYQIQASFTVT